MEQKEGDHLPGPGRERIVLGMDPDTMRRLRDQARRHLRPTKNEALLLIVKGLEPLEQRSESEPDR